MLYLPLCRLGGVARLHKHHALVLINSIDLIVIDDLLRVVHVVQRFWIEHIIAVHILLLPVLHLGFRMDADAFLATMVVVSFGLRLRESLPILFIELLIGNQITSCLSQAVVKLVGGEGTVLLLYRSPLARPLQLRSLPVDLPLQKHTVHHLLHFVRLLALHACPNFRTRAILTPDSR